MGRTKVELLSRLRKTVAQHPTEFQTDGKILRCIPIVRSQFLTKEKLMYINT